MESTSGARITPKTLNGENDIDTLCLQAIHELMKDGASRKKLSPRDIRALKRAKPRQSRNRDNLDGEITIARVLRLHVHKQMHVISTASPPNPLDTWPEKQDETDIKGKIRLLPDHDIKGEGISFCVNHHQR